MTSTRREPMDQATHTGLAASLWQTSARWCDQFWACQVASQKQAGCLADVERDGHFAGAYHVRGWRCFRVRLENARCQGATRDAHSREKSRARPSSSWVRYRPQIARRVGLVRPQLFLRCLREDRLSLLEQSGLDEPAALANEFGHGVRSLAEVSAGLERFRAGEGRHGAFS